MKAQYRFVWTIFWTQGIIFEIGEEIQKSKNIQDPQESLSRDISVQLHDLSNFLVSRRFQEQQVKDVVKSLTVLIHPSHLALNFRNIDKNN